MCKLIVYNGLLSLLLLFFFVMGLLFDVVNAVATAATYVAIATATTADDTNPALP